MKVFDVTVQTNSFSSPHVIPVFADNTSAAAEIAVKEANRLADKHAEQYEMPRGRTFTVEQFTAEHVTKIETVRNQVAS